VNQIDRIRQVIESMGPNNLFNTDEIRQQTDFPRPSIRRVLSTLAKNEEINRIETGLFKTGDDGSFQSGGELVDFRRKFVSGLFYCSGRKRQFFALTFEANNRDREEELVQFLEDEIASDCSELRENHGYSDESGFDSETSVPRYPDIQGGEL